MRILIVEDDTRTAEYVVKGLSEAGHLAEVITDGRDALSHAARRTFASPRSAGRRRSDADDFLDRYWRDR